MARSNFGSIIIRGIRAANRADQASQRAALRAHAQAARAQLQAQRRDAADTRAMAREAKADAREDARAHVASQIQEAEELTHALADREEEISNLLRRALRHDPKAFVRLERKVFTPKRFDECAWKSTAPRLESFAPPQQGFIARHMPGAAGRQQAKEDEAAARYARANEIHKGIVAAREVARLEHERIQDRARREIETYNLAMDASENELAAAKHPAVIAYFTVLLEKNFDEEHDALGAEVGYSPESKHLVIDLEMPDITVIPEEASFKYTKSTDHIDPVVRPLAKRKALYANLLAQIVLKCVDTVFRGTRGEAVECLTINGMLDAVDPSTGHDIRHCLISVRVTTDDFKGLNLDQVKPERCLASLKASVSRSPADLLPVRPIVELNMVDPRFVEATDILSGLDARPNLMDFSPNQFEGLITHLFTAMGLETRQTQASRDGGVDCVAFDRRPIFGGKVVIQAKRYKNTVGVSAVRDLFGTMQNEGASKGILVTTSGYGKAAFDFAKGKPIELLDGGNLLFLLAEHAGMDARIIMPDDWKDVAID
jgi:restriction system protein